MREINEEVQALLGDLEETCRRLTAQLDNRTTRLEQLLAEADEKIRKLHDLAGNAAGAQGPALYASRSPEPEGANRGDRCGGARIAAGAFAAAARTRSAGSDG